MPMVTKLVRVATNCEELPHINLHDLSMRLSCSSHDNLNTLNLHLQKTYGHQTKEGMDLDEKLPPLKQHDALIT